MVSDESGPSNSRFGALLVAVAVGGSAVAVVGWHLLSNRGGGRLDTSGFDLNTAADRAITRRGHLGAGNDYAAPEPSLSLGMVKPGAGMRVGPSPTASGRGASSRYRSAAAGAASRKERDARSLKEAAIKHEKFFDALGRRTEAKYPSLTQYGKDWVSYPDLRALRDRYHRDHNPIKFAYGMVKSDNFGKLLKQYSDDPGVRVFLMEAVKRAPADLRSAAGQVFRNDHVAKGLVDTVAKSLGLQASLTSFLGDDASKPPGPNQIMSDVVKDAKKTTAGRQR